MGGVKRIGAVNLSENGDRTWAKRVISEKKPSQKLLQLEGRTGVKSHYLQLCSAVAPSILVRSPGHRVLHGPPGRVPQRVPKAQISCLVCLGRHGIGRTVHPRSKVLTIGGLSTGTQAQAIKKGCHMVVVAWLNIH